MTTQPNRIFQARARFEAERYGADVWVFVRELLQNARDAGASRVWFEVASGDGVDRVSCRDDGGGMTLAHARDYLFTLYASSKHGGFKSAGRFGIGFWSILRFSPSGIMIRSRPIDGEGWQVRLNRALEVENHDAIEMRPGTEIVVEREASGDDIESLVRAAVLRDAPFLTRRGSREDELQVQVNGTVVRAEFDLPPPSMKFRRRGIRGVVGLGAVAGVEIFVHGLKVRDASSFDDLLLTGRRGRAGLPTIRDGLAPRALIDSSALTVLLARGDTREDRSLRRLVAVGHRELRRLVRAELDRYARPSTARRAVEWAREAWATSGLLRFTIIGLLLVLAGYGGFRLAAGVSKGRADPGVRPSMEIPYSGRPDGLSPYTDIGGRYQGPDADVLGGPSTAVDLTYRPARERKYFAALLITGIAPDGGPLYPMETGGWSASGPPCVEDCLDVELAVAADSGVLRLPVPTGYAVDPSSVRWNTEQLLLVENLGGLPAVNLGEVRSGRVAYRCAAADGVADEVSGRWPPLPRELAGTVTEIATLPIDARAPAAVDLVRRRVVYDASETTAERHLSERRRGRGLFERSLIVGAGDCDVQNAVVAAILENVGVSARLAVGWVGEAGRATPGLHAWVEYQGSDGRWRVADASAGTGGARPSAAVPPPLISGRPRLHPMVLPGTLAVSLLIGIALLVGLRDRRRTFSLGGRQDIADLVRAAIVHPEEFVGMHALFTRRVVPVLGGSPISIARARVAAAKGRLAAGGRESDLAVRAAERGTVIDAGTAEGAAVAGALGAVDLDAWQRLLSRSQSDPIAARVGEELTRVGEPCHLRTARTVEEEIACLDGFRLGLPRGERWVVVDQAGEVWRRVRDLAGRRPSAAALVLADSVSDRLGLPPTARDAVLAKLARAALAEQVGGVS